MSQTVVKAIHLTGGYEAKETVNSIEIVDKLFDCMNVSSLSRGKLNRKLLPNHTEIQKNSKLL